MRFISDHWHGELSLPRSYWINHFLLTWLLWSVVAVHIEMGDAVSSSMFVIVLYVVVFLIYLPIHVWQMVGVWRSSDNYEGSVFWAKMAKFMMALFALKIALLYGGFLLDPPRSYVELQAQVLKKD